MVGEKGGITNGRRYTVCVQIRNDGLKAYADGKCMVQWKTDYSDMSIDPEWSLREATTPGLGMRGGCDHFPQHQGH